VDGCNPLHCNEFLCRVGMGSPFLWACCRYRQRLTQAKEECADRYTSPLVGDVLSLSTHQKDQVDVWACRVQQGQANFSFTLRPGCILRPGGIFREDGNGIATPVTPRDHFESYARGWIPVARELARAGFASLVDVELDVERSLFEQHAAARGVQGLLPALPGDPPPWHTLGGLFVCMFSYLLTPPPAT
jgi:hypothetical protein